RAEKHRHRPVQTGLRSDQVLGLDRGQILRVQMPAMPRPTEQAVTEQQRPLRVMLVDDYPERAEVLERALTASSHQIVARLGSGANLRAEVTRLAPDVVIIDLDSADRDILEDMHAKSRSMMTTSGAR